MGKSAAVLMLMIITLIHADVSDAAGRYSDKSMNPLHMLVVFTKFKGEAPGVNDAPAWASEMFDGKPGSVTHFFENVSFGQYKISGDYTAKYYELPHPQAYYQPEADTPEIKKLDLYAKDVMALLDADPDFDFSDFDNDGADGIPGSSDDDHYIDYMVLMPRTRQYDFIFKLATGIWTIGLKDEYVSKDKSSEGFAIKVEKYSGCISVANSKNEAVGTIVSELSHALADGALDLMDKMYEGPPENDSAGVGFWDFLGKGALGWNYQNGPMGPCAYNRIRMDSAGKYNSNLIKLFGFQENVAIADVGQEGGNIYKIPLTTTENEFFLIEFRRSKGFYYDMYIPQDGLLISHVLYGETNNNEKMKLVDIECADGRYLDYGYPKGKKPDPVNGGDNLDFWAHDTSYTREHEGNEGDSFDVFDGVRYTEFGSATNPNTFSKKSGARTGVEIFNIRKNAAGDTMYFDCIVPPFHNWFEERYPFIGAAYHRFASTGYQGAAKAADQGLYLIRSGNNRKPTTLVTVEDDEMKVEFLSMLDRYEVDDFVTRRLMRSESDAKNSLIKRNNIDIEIFENLVREFGVSLSELGRDGSPTLVQKVLRQSSDDVKPYTITLNQNYPNPFNATTTISYMLPRTGSVTLEVYNTLGQKIMEIDKGEQGMGMHAIQIDAGNIASGIYLYRLKAGTISETKRFTYIR